MAATLVTGGVLLGGTTAVAAPGVPVPSRSQPAEQAAKSVPVSSHAQAAGQTEPTSQQPWGHLTTLGVHPNWNHQIPGLVTQNPYLSDKQAANVSSGNWAGLAQVGATYTGVSASWTVPTIQPIPSSGVSSSWIGIDGFSNQDLIQTGTEQDISGGVAGYDAWYEILPAPETAIGGVHAGDHMSASIVQVSPPTPTTQGKWTISITDNTLGFNFTRTFSYGGGGTDGQPANSAEWIEEMTSETPTQPPLANFGTANFTNLNYTTSNPTGNTPTLIRMVNSLHTTTAFPTIPGASDLNVTYGPPSTTTAVTASPGSPTLGTSVTYSATVTGGTPAGSVTFSTGSTPLCTATLSSGSGSCSSTAAPLGTNLIFGTYS
ncbi:MAG TPA: G1 family glutamic endopeptidase, partial [Acidimicrobiales bacterium]|nr:G1 family glutamic endopeptidase [Acidimicrobiales bacterium]